MILMTHYTPGKKSSSRRRVLAGAVILEACLGVILAWPLFAAKICSKAGANCVSPSKIGLIFSISLAAFAAALIFSGNLLNKKGPGHIVLAGGTILAAGYWMGGFFGSNDAAHLIFIGIAGGGGAGLAYLVPVFQAIRCFPDIRGFAVGLTVAGFGSGALFWELFAESLAGVSVLGLGPLRSVYLIFGGLLIVFVTIGRILIMKETGEPERDAWFSSPAETYRVPAGAFTPTALMKSRSFHVLFFAFFLLTLAGLFVYGQIRPFGVESLRATGLDVKIAVRVVALVLFLFQLMNIVGSVLWGAASDRIGRRQAISLLCVLQGAAIFLLFYTRGTAQSIILFSSIVGLNMGGIFSLLPLLTVDSFDEKNLQVCCGPIFASCVFAGLAGLGLTVLFRDAAGSPPSSSWSIPFILSGIASLTAAAILFFISRKLAVK